MYLLNPHSFGFTPGDFGTGNPGGTGDRTASITVTSSHVPSSGTLNNLVDGATANNATDALRFTNGSTEVWIKFDFGSGNIREIQSVFWDQSVSGSQGTWRVYASNDDIQWDMLCGNTVMDDGTTFTLTPTGGYRYYMMFQVDGATNGTPWQTEVDFSIRNNIAKVPTPSVPSYDNLGGRGDRTSLITATTTLGTGAGTFSKIITGRLNNDTALNWRPATSESAGNIKFDFATGKIITEAIFYQQLTSSHGTWQWAGSNDDSGYTNIGSTFTLGGVTEQTITTMSANVTAYRYYRCTLTAGNTGASNNIWKEIEFKIAS